MNELTHLTTSVIAIDGPSASGKGTVSQRVAHKLGFHYLDSGALYRIVAFAALQNKVLWNNDDGLAKLAKSLRITFKNDEIFLNDHCITNEIRAEDISRGASEIAVHPMVRLALLDIQREFKRQPGLVADGRDMGSVVFKEAQLKIYLTASVEIRALRRFNQLSGNVQTANLDQILFDLKLRDTRDSQRNTAPLMQTNDALLLNTNNIDIDAAVNWVIAAYENLNKNI